ncbi:hypothetical protein B7494_g7115 [Chlorociboria aeruginascens]|nr:hypothetical protein B7494_g7115 [Chlorociboria aeruginascens]
METDQVFESHEDWVFCVSFSPDGRYLASGGDDFNVLIWDLEHDKGKGKKTPDKRLADIAIWDWQTGKCLQILPRGEVDDDIQPFTSLQIDVQYPNVLITNLGSWPLDMDSLLKQQQELTILRRPLPAQWCPCGLSDDCSWVTYENKNIIFLPKSYRPTSGYQCQVHRRWMVIGSNSGQVMLFKFAEGEESKTSISPGSKAISGS